MEIALAKEFIKTIRKEKGKEDREQWWLASVPGQFPSIGNLMSVTGKLETYRMKNTVQEMEQYAIRDIKMIPLTKATILAYKSREYHRGYDNDTDPFMYRGNPIPEIKIKYNNRSMYVVNSDLTHACKEKILMEYRDQLEGCFNHEFLQYLTEIQIRAFFKRLENVLRQLTESIHEFSEKISEMNPYK